MLRSLPKRCARRTPWIVALAIALLATSPAVHGESSHPDREPTPKQAGTDAAEEVSPPLSHALSEEDWARMEESVDRGLTWLATRQADDGSFQAPSAAQPAVTALALLAFLSRGHQPGVGLYGEQLNDALDFILSCQASDGLFTNEPLSPPHSDKTPTHTATYNHAIAGLALCEAYGMTTRDRADHIKAAIGKALEFTRLLQDRPKVHAVDQGGWRYFYLRWNEQAADSDLSVTGWQVLFLRAAQNAEFIIPQEQIQRAMEYVQRCYDRNARVFNYALVGSGDVRSSRGMVGVGILSLSMGGMHQTPMAQAAGDWLLSHPFQHFGHTVGSRDRFFYSAYYCSQAMAQLGGHHWNGFYPRLVAALVSGQRPDGSWPPEPAANDAVFGNALTTSLAILALTPAYQLLPVYQR